MGDDDTNMLLLEEKKKKIKINISERARPRG